MKVEKIFEKIEIYSPISVGMRTFKTFIACTLTALIGLTFIILNPFYALMGAVFGMQNTVTDSFKMGFGRIVGTAIGATIGFIFTYFQLNSPLAIGFAVTIVIIICGLLNIKHAILITVTLCLLVMFNPREGGLLYYTTRRTLDTAIGVMIAVLINRFIAPPNHLKALVMELEVMLRLTKKVLEDNSKLPQLKKELALLVLAHSNYEADEKFDTHHVSNNNLRLMIEACNELYFHLKNSKAPDATIRNYHAVEINKTLILLEKNLDELKGVI